MKYMEEAIKEAMEAFREREVPVGCVIVKDGRIIARAHNTTEQHGDATRHAEMNAIRQAVKAVGEKTLDGCEMYVTLEPCAMCAGAVINTRIKRLYVGACEPKSGCCGSALNLFNARLNHTPEIYMGINEEECGNILKNFFKDKR